MPGAEPLPPLRWYVSPADAARRFRAALEAELAGYHVFNVGAADSFSSKPSLVVAESEYGILPRFAGRSTSTSNRAHLYSTAPSLARRSAGRRATIGPLSSLHSAAEGNERGWGWDHMDRQLDC